MPNVVRELARPPVFDIEAQVPEAVAPAAPLSLATRLHYSAVIPAVRFREDMRGVYNTYVRHEEGFQRAAYGLIGSAACAYFATVALIQVCIGSREITENPTDPCTIRGEYFSDCPEQGYNIPGCWPKYAIPIYPSMVLAPFALYAACLSGSLLRGTGRFIGSMARQLPRLTQADIDVYHQQQAEVAEHVRRDDAIIEQREQAAQIDFMPQARVRGRENIATNVHDQARLSVARDQLQALLSVMTDPKKLHGRVETSDMATFRQIQNAITQYARWHPGSDGQIASDRAKLFFEQVKNDVYFRTDYGDLVKSPNELIAQLWRLFISTENAVRTFDKLKDHDKVKYMPLVGYENLTDGLVEEMARIVVDIGGVSNPCGAGQVARLLNYSSTVIPDLDVFKAHLTALPANPERVNEYLSDMNR